MNLPLGTRFALTPADDLDALDEVCREADRLMTAWAREQGIGCPSGCGICCDGFVPDALPIEAEYLALHLLSHQPAAAALVLARPSGPVAARCPFYDPSSPAHCSVYEARPLVCRLFGFGGTRGKAGDWVFRLCRHMPAPAGWGAAREISGLSHPQIPPPPLMSDIEARVQGLRPADAGRTRPLPEALREALARLFLRKAFGDSDNEPPQGGSNGRAA